MPGPWLLTAPVSLGLAPGPGTSQTVFRNIIFILHFEKPRQGTGRRVSQGYAVAKQQPRLGTWLGAHVVSPMPPPGSLGGGGVPPAPPFDQIGQLCLPLSLVVSGGPGERLLHGDPRNLVPGRRQSLRIHPLRSQLRCMDRKHLFSEGICWLRSQGWQVSARQSFCSFVNPNGGLAPAP